MMKKTRLNTKLAAMVAGIALMLSSSLLLADTYPLDNVSREIPSRGKVKCPKVPKIKYKGDFIRYHKPTTVYVGFVERLRKFEKVAIQVAKEVYGRAPKKLKHLGTYNCRRIGGYPGLVSEHGLANGIDVAGFDFGRMKASAGEALPEGVPSRLKRPFKVRMLKHWDGKRGVNALHARFLRTLARRLIDRKDIFRVLLGPSYPGHKNHFHFDCSPWRLVDIFEEDEP